MANPLRSSRMPRRIRPRHDRSPFAACAAPWPSSFAISAGGNAGHHGDAGIAGDDAAGDRAIAGDAALRPAAAAVLRSEEHTSELQSLMRISYAVFCLKKKNKKTSQ